MKILTSDVQIREPSVLTIGNFDGVHAGHRMLISKTKEIALCDSLQSVVFSFSPHPFEVIGEPGFKRILTEREKRAVIETLSPDVLVEYPFTPGFSRIGPLEFVRYIIVERCHAKKLVIGEGCRFGRGKSGDAALLRRLGEEYGFEVIIIPPLSFGGKKISSSEIRRMILEKEFTQAENLLHSHYFVSGTVLRGKKNGRKLGFPTANLKPPENKLLPPDGVYATRIFVEGMAHDGITNIGKKPTFNAGERTIETYIFDFDKTIYGEHIRLEFFEFMREEIKFGSAGELVGQLNRDVELRRKIIRTVQIHDR